MGCEVCCNHSLYDQALTKQRMKKKVSQATSDGVWGVMQPFFVWSSTDKTKDEEEGEPKSLVRWGVRCDATISFAIKDWRNKGRRKLKKEVQPERKGSGALLTHSSTAERELEHCKHRKRIERRGSIEIRNMCKLQCKPTPDTKGIWGTVNTGKGQGNWVAMEVGKSALNYILATRLEKVHHIRQGGRNDAVGWMSSWERYCKNRVISTERGEYRLVYDQRRRHRGLRNKT